MEAIAALLTDPEFQAGVVLGIAGLLLLVALRRQSIDWGLIWAAAALLAPVTARLFGAEAGRDLNLDTLQPTPTILVAATAAAAVAAAGLIRSRVYQATALGLAISIAGIWATVPDTEEVAVLVGVTAGLIWAWWPAGWSWPGIAGSVAIVGIAAWLAVEGGLARDTGMVGAFGSLAALGWSAFALPIGRPLIWLLGHLATVLVWSRWAGLSDSVATALVIGLPATVLIAAGARLAERLSPRPA